MFSDYKLITEQIKKDCLESIARTRKNNFLFNVANLYYFESGILIRP